jgi:uncharacterized protein (TIGR04255 family)
VDFFALSTKDYSHWRNFKNDLGFVESAVREIYHPGPANRIGLRFVNRFTRKNTGSKDTTEILQLFRSELTCLIQAEAWLEPAEMLSQIVLVEGKTKLTLRTGFGREKKEPFFVLDFDCFEEGQINLDHLIERIEPYHTKIYDAFRWCLLDESLERFSPRS